MTAGFDALDARQRRLVDGYGGDPRDPDAWARTRVREAVATAAWAHQVGDEAFEREGLALVAEVLAGA